MSGIMKLPIVYVVAVLAYARYGLALWPWTRGLSRGAAGLVVDPLMTLGSGLVANIPRIGFLIVLFVMIRLVLPYRGMLPAMSSSRST